LVVLKDETACRVIKITENFGEIRKSDIRDKSPPYFVRAISLKVKPTRRYLFVIYITPKVTAFEIVIDSPHTISGGNNKS
jgi:hypothetical protein